jgi:hypothetical protein
VGSGAISEDHDSALLSARAKNVFVGASFIATVNSIAVVVNTSIVRGRFAARIHILQLSIKINIEC